MIKDNSRPSILEVNSFYLFIGIILLTLGSYAQSRGIYSGLLITEYVIILLPTIFFLKMRGYSLKKVLRLNKISFKQVLIIPFIVLFSYPIGVFFNYLMMIVINHFGKINPNPVPIPENTQEMVLGFIVVALSAGICEEVMFRGFVMKAYEKKGIKLGIMYSALLFGLFHFNIQNLLGPIFLGVLFGYIVYKTETIFSSIIAHTANNAIALVLGMLITKNIDVEMAAEAAESGIISETTAMIIGAVGIGFVALICGIIVFFLLKLLPKAEKIQSEEIGVTQQVDISLQEEPTSTNKESIISFIPIFIVLLIFCYITYEFFII